MDDSDSRYNYSYQEHSDLSGMLDTNRESASEDEEGNDDGKSSTISGSTAESTVTLVDDKENRTPLVGSTPASRLSSTTQVNRNRDRVINVSAVMDKNKQLEATVYQLKMRIGDINKELPWIMIDGVDHMAQYIHFKRDNEGLRTRLAQMENNIQLMKDDNKQMVKEERDRVEQEHMEVIATLRADYEKVCQECDALREEVGQLPPSPADLDRSAMSDGSSMWSERSRQCGMHELRIAALEKDVQAAKFKEEAERNAAERAQRELDELRMRMEEQAREWERRESIATLQETFHIGIPDGSKKDLMNKISEQLARIDFLEKELEKKNDIEKKLTHTVLDMIKQKDELANELRMAREMSMSMMENGEVDELMRELLELSEMNTHLQDICRRHGAIGMGRHKEGEREEMDEEQIKKELETTQEIVDQYQKIGERLGPLNLRIAAMNKSVMDRRSFLEGLKAFEVSGLTPLRLEGGSYNGTPETPAGRGRSRLLHSVLQKSVMNVSHVDILNCSINTSQGIKHAKDKLLAMKDSCQKLFEKLQSSYALFDEIRIALGGEDNSDLARQMADLRMELEMSVMESGEAAKAIAIVENSLFELQSMLETSMGGMGRESDFNLSTALRREEGEKEERDEVKKMSMTYSIDMTANGERQDVIDMREKYSTLIEDHRMLQVECDELKKKKEEMDVESEKQKKKNEKLHLEREELYREVESRREKEQNLIKENERLMVQLEEVIEEVNRRKTEIEYTAANMQDHIEQLESEAFEANRQRESEVRQKEEEIETMRRMMDEKEVEITTINGRMAEISKELEGMRDVERKSVIKMSRLEREAESYKENFERSSAEYAKLNEELESGKTREQELEKKLQKYKFKAIEDAQTIRKANERDDNSTQTSLTMDKLSRMEWSKGEMQKELSRLGRTIEDAFLKKGEGRGADSERCFDETDVNRLVDIVVREKRKKDENNAMMERTNEELKRYVETSAKKDSRVSSPVEDEPLLHDVMTTTEGGVNARYEDPIRRLFHALTTVAHNIVQAFKNAQTKMMSGRLSEAEYNRILSMLRDLRKELNDRLSMVSQKKASDPEAGDARMALRLAVVMEANDKLQTRINTLLKALGSDLSAEDKAKLLAKVVAEMNDISKTLKTVVGVKQARVPSSSSTATGSTRKI